jgi:hypothetical protein
MGFRCGPRIATAGWRIIALAFVAESMHSITGVQPNGKDFCSCYEMLLGIIN